MISSTILYDAVFQIKNKLINIIGLDFHALVTKFSLNVNKLVFFWRKKKLNEKNFTHSFFFWFKNVIAFDSVQN